MKSLTFAVISLCLGEGYALCDATEEFEPCLLTNNKELPYVATRHPSISYSHTTDDTRFCDLYALQHGQWYRSNYNITNYCVDHRKCGTSDPIYLQGDLPNTTEGVVNSTACIRTFQNCCELTLNLRIKNCVYYMVYCFLELNPSCHSRFCLDVDLSKETTSTTTPTTTTTMTSTTTESERSTEKETDEQRCKIKETSERGCSDVHLGLASVNTAFTAAVLCLLVYIIKRTKIAANLPEKRKTFPYLVPNSYQKSVPPNVQIMQKE